jgi:hypothetical protein
MFPNHLNQQSNENLNILNNQSSPYDLPMNMNHHVNFVTPQPKLTSGKLLDLNGSIGPPSGFQPLNPTDSFA